MKSGYFIAKASRIFTMKRCFPSQFAQKPYKWGRRRRASTKMIELKLFLLDFAQWIGKPSTDSTPWIPPAAGACPELLHICGADVPQLPAGGTTTNPAPAFGEGVWGCPSLRAESTRTSPRAARTQIHFPPGLAFISPSHWHLWRMKKMKKRRNWEEEEQPFNSWDRAEVKLPCPVQVALGDKGHCWGCLGSIFPTQIKLGFTKSA